MTLPSKSRRIAMKKANAALIEVAGTWDFKWPLGSVIRVGFQLPKTKWPANDLSEAIAVIEELARSWTDGQTRAPIGFRFIKEYYPRPRQHTPTPSPLSDSEHWARDYDVLVSLDEPPKEGKYVGLPTSESGTFARRANYGVPTMCIGPMQGRWKREGRPYRSLAEYYVQDPVARYCVLHEFGHALGLAHENQNPEMIDRFKNRLPGLEELANEWKRLEKVDDAAQKSKSIVTYADEELRLLQKDIAKLTKMLGANPRSARGAHAPKQDLTPEQTAYVHVDLQCLQERERLLRKIRDANQPRRPKIEKTPQHASSQKRAPKNRTTQEQRIEPLLSKRAQRTLAELKERLEAGVRHMLGVTELPRDMESTRFIVAHIAEVWPGKPEFSDWRDEVDEDSVMMIPYYDCMAGFHGTKLPRIPCATCWQRVEARAQQGPSRGDLDHLRSMYL